MTSISRLLPEQKQEIKNAFRGWDGKSLQKSQRKIFDRYNLVFERGGKHNRIYQEGNENKIFHSATSSDHRAGINFALTKT